MPVVRRNGRPSVPPLTRAADTGAARDKGRRQQEQPDEYEHAHDRKTILLRSMFAIQFQTAPVSFSWFCRMLSISMVPMIRATATERPVMAML